MSILISGYFGFGNAGDELILHSLLRALGPYCDSLAVLSHNPRDTERVHRVRALSRSRVWALGRELSRCQAVISGGGGLIQDLSGPFTPLYYLGLLQAAHCLRKRFLILGQGFGPVRHWWNKSLARSVLSQAEAVIVRDSHAWEWCRKLPLSYERLQLGADLVWRLPTSGFSQRDSWVICLRSDYMQGNDLKWLEVFRQEAARCKRKLVFVALGNRGDRELLHQLQGMKQFCDSSFLDATQPEIYFKGAELFRGAEWVLSMRYHGIVLGALAGAAVTGFGPDPKLSYVLEDLEQPCLSNPPQRQELQKIIPQLPNLIKILIRRRERLCQRSQAGLTYAKTWIARVLQAAA